MNLGEDLENALSVFGELRHGPKAKYYFGWSLFSFVFCVAVHHIVSPWVFARYNKLYRNLPRPKKMEWDSRVVSSIHATIVSILCVVALVTNANLWSNPITCVTHAGLIALSISIGYFLCGKLSDRYDEYFPIKVDAVYHMTSRINAVSMPFYWRNNQLIIFLLHHWAASFAFYYVVRYRCCVFFGVYRLTTELSTPFVNQRWFYRTIGYKPDRRRVACVTFIFAIFFIITRNLMILPFWIIFYASYRSDAYNTVASCVPSIGIIFLSTCGVLDCLNIYWAFRTCHLGHKAAKLLWAADWRNDIRKARARLHKRLRKLHQRVASNANIRNDMSLKLGLLKDNHYSDISLNQTISGMSSSSFSTSDSELDSVYSDSEFKVSTENDKNESNTIYVNSCQNIDSDDDGIRLVHRFEK
ncbi:Transmembrane protein 56-B [Schistosoma japonicum]|nr:Transmembrane protein 56-B [Schistosoma japonicum]